MSVDCRIFFILVCSLLFVVCLSVIDAEANTNKAKVSKSEKTNPENTHHSHEEVESNAENVRTDSEEKSEEEKGSKEKDLEYEKGSLCGYCTYCKFCKLCDRDCPCEMSPSKPNCHLCKYCKFCYLCKLACDTVCRPGGLVDVVSSTLYNQLPTINKEEVDRDLDEARDWIDKAKKEEL